MQVEYQKAAVAEHVSGPQSYKSVGVSQYDYLTILAFSYTRFTSSSTAKDHLHSSGTEIQKTVNMSVLLHPKYQGYIKYVLAE